MKKRNGKSIFMLPVLAVCMALFLTALPSDRVFADGDETLGPPSIPIASGSGIVAAGVGLATSQPQTINIAVPLATTVNQVLLYWEGKCAPGDDIIEVEGNPVVGSLIGDIPFPGCIVEVFRADITGLGLVGAGVNSISVGGLNFDRVADGAGILVIFDDGSNIATIDIRDGNDYAYLLESGSLPASYKTTDPQTFAFAPAAFARTAQLSLFFSSVAGSASTGGFRPNAVEVSIDGGPPIVFDNLLDSNDGEEWDTVNLDVPIPAGATSLTVQALSVDNDPPLTGPEGQLEGEEASFYWITAGFSIITPFCGDGIVDPGETCDPPFSIPDTPPGNENECRETSEIMIILMIVEIIARHLSAEMRL
jgi:hypothetical protein